MPLCGGTRVHVAAWFEIAGQGRDRRVEVAAGEGRFGRAGTNRCRADAEISKPDRTWLGTRRGRKTDQRVVAVPARQFGKAKSVTRLRDRYPDGADNLAGGERGLEQALEKRVGSNGAPAGTARDLDLATKRQQAGRKLRCRIRECNRTPDGTAIVIAGCAI